MHQTLGSYWKKSDFLTLYLVKRPTVYFDISRNKQDFNQCILFYFSSLESLGPVQHKAQVQASERSFEK